MTTNIDNNTIKLSEDAITSIVKIAVDEMEGVSVLENRYSSALTRSKSIKVKFEDNNLNIDVITSVKYNENIQEIAKKLQAHIASNIEIMTNLKANTINVIVNDVTF